MDSQIEMLWGEYRSIIQGKELNSAGNKNGIEGKAGLIYQRLVVLGAAPQIKRKYRRR